MELKITLMLLIFLVISLVGNSMYEEVRGIVTQNKGNPGSALLKRNPFVW